MKKLVASFAAGSLFAIGLVVSGMTLPSKVTAFLDVTGAWDPSLMLVMGSAIPIYALAYRFALRRGRPAFDARLHLPERAGIDARLVVGAVLFGVGWGVVGYCPGPAILAVATGRISALWFVGAMIAGMAVFELVESLRGAKPSAIEAPARGT